MTDAAEVRARAFPGLLAVQVARGVNALLDVASPRMHVARPVRGSTQE